MVDNKTLVIACHVKVRMDFSFIQISLVIWPQALVCTDVIGLNLPLKRDYNDH